MITTSSLNSRKFFEATVPRLHYVPKITEKAKENCECGLAAILLTFAFPVQK